MYKTGSEIVAVWTTLGISALQERSKFNLNFRWTSKSLEGRKQKQQQQKNNEKQMTSSHNYLFLPDYSIIYKQMRKKKPTSCQDNYAEDTKQFCDTPAAMIHLPCFSTSLSGSTPGDRIKNIGVAGPDSSKEAAKSRGLPATNLLPSFSSTKSLSERERSFANRLQVRKESFPCK